MNIAIASDHAGFGLKTHIARFVHQQLEHDVEDLGTDSRKRCDFPEYAERVARAVASKEADLGILICGTGIGMSVAANKIHDIVAAACSDCYTARMAREHNAANILCMGGRVIGTGRAEQITQTFLTSEPIMAPERYVRRRRQIDKLYRDNRPG